MEGHKKARKSPTRYGDSRGQEQSSGRRARSEPESRHASSPSLFKGRVGYGGPVPGQRGHGQPGRRFSGPNQGYGNPVQRQRSFRGPNLENQGRGGRGSIAHQARPAENPGERSGYEWSGQYGKGSAVPEQSGDQYGYGAPGQISNYDCPNQERNYSEDQENFYSLGTDQGQGHGGNVDPGYWRNFNYGDQGPGQYQVQDNYEAPNHETREPADRVQYTNGYECSNQQDEGNYPNWHPDVRELGQAHVRYGDENMGRLGETEGELEQGEGWINNEGTGQQDQWHDEQAGEELGQCSYNNGNGNQRSMYDSSHYHDAN
ncbi:PREDICTED: sodium/potassium/calcium exchanger 1-like [Drosophila arizonae]|uniref:Sodium/potassium/calcium exchanger 1-like n=1 Tax=Drosophila arizonae TaxID=7263 RepID=A0ABM1Q3Q0_DROAR|nr:PREDICTED: sodium/potassium/calcium exchanger 1-like [Drosophila arizonae]